MQRSHRRSRGRAIAATATARGMTTSDTMLILVVIGLFATIVAYKFSGNSLHEPRELTIRRIETVTDGLESYAIDNGGMFPSTEQGLKALLERPAHPPVPHRWQRPYVEAPSALTDAWEMPLHYVCPGGDGRIYDLWSNGADKAEGGKDANADIQSWNRSSMCL